MQILNVVLIIILTIYVFLIFPFFLSIKVKLNVCDKKLYYKICLFNVLTILNGYVELKIDGIFIHLTNKKAIKISYKNFFNSRAKVEPLRDYHVINFYSFLYIGCKTSAVKKTQIAFIYNYIKNNLEWFFYHKKPYLKIDNNVAITEISNNVVYYAKATFVFNTLMILISLTKILVEKMFYAIKKS